MALISVAFFLLALIVCIPAYIVFAEVLAATILTRCEPDEKNTKRATVAFLIPAHNEGKDIIPTINDVKAQRKEGDRILVVADNCSDDTASIAAAAGVEVVQRNNCKKIGKGYALDFGIDYLKSAPPEVILIIDADCRLSTDAVDTLVSVCTRTKRPVQALYLMMSSSNNSSAAAAEFFWRVKNWVRPLGLRKLGGPCHLVGSGMAIPWPIAPYANFANGNIVEDLNAGLAFASSGHAPVFCASARVTSHFASSEEGKSTQRERWEHGHLRTILSTPKLLYRALSHTNLDLLILTLDLFVPPLSLLALLLLAATLMAFALTLLGIFLPLMVCLSGICAFMAAVILSWLWFGRDIISLSSLLTMLRYTANKIPFYVNVILRGLVSEWKRTDRSKPLK